MYQCCHGVCARLHELGERRAGTTGACVLFGRVHVNVVCQLNDVRKLVYRVRSVAARQGVFRHSCVWKRWGRWRTTLTTRYRLALFPCSVYQICGDCCHRVVTSCFDEKVVNIAHRCDAKRWCPANPNSGWRHQLVRVERPQCPNQVVLVRSIVLRRSNRHPL